jgi:predicted Zn-dependent protease
MLAADFILHDPLASALSEVEVVSELQKLEVVLSLPYQETLQVDFMLQWQESLLQKQDSAQEEEYSGDQCHNSPLAWVSQSQPPVSDNHRQVQGTQLFECLRQIKSQIPNQTPRHHIPL